jgi:hypothetical protein
MNELIVILGYQISVGIWEILIFQLGAMVLGFFIHFFIVSRKSVTASASEPSVLAESAIDPGEWKLKYLEGQDTQKKVMEDLKKELVAAQENEELLNIELEELKKIIDDLRKSPSPAKPVPTPVSDYLLPEQHQRIASLQEQLEIARENERKHVAIQSMNDQLSAQLSEWRKINFEQEALIKQLRQEQLLVVEMKERLAHSQEEFMSLQEKLKKMETYLAQPHYRSYEYEDLQQNYLRLTKEHDELRFKQMTILEENQRLTRLMTDTEDKLREANFQRQGLLKKITYLEELNFDLQQLSGHNKKLEMQLKRLSEIESLISKAATGRKSEG